MSTFSSSASTVWKETKYQRDVKFNEVWERGELRPNLNTIFEYTLTHLYLWHVLLVLAKVRRKQENQEFPRTGDMLAEF